MLVKKKTLNLKEHLSTPIPSKRSNDLPILKESHDGSSGSTDLIDVTKIKESFKFDDFDKFDDELLITDESNTATPCISQQTSPCPSYRAP